MIFSLLFLFLSACSTLRPAQPFASEKAINQSAANQNIERSTAAAGCGTEFKKFMQKLGEDSTRLNFKGVPLDANGHMNVAALHKDILTANATELGFLVFQHPDLSIREASTKRLISLSLARLRGVEASDATQLNEALPAMQEELKRISSELDFSNLAPFNIEEAAAKLSLTANSNYANQAESSYAQLLTLCLSYGRGPECASSLKSVIDDTLPKTISFIEYIKLYGTKFPRPTQLAIGQRALINEAYTDPKIIKTAIQAAQNMLERIQNLESGKAIAPTDLLTELKEASRVALGQEDEDVAWKLLGFYGVRGPLIHPFWSLMPDTERKAMTAACETIFSSITYLDILQHQKTAQWFSIPKEFTSPVALAKPYHFWMPAYLVRKLVKEGVSEKNASTAVHISYVGYEFSSETMGRTPYLGVVQGTFSDYNQNIRLNMVVSAAGNRYGVADSTHTPLANTIDLDEVWKAYNRELSEEAMLNEQEARELWSGGVLERMKAYKKWRSVLKPDEPYDMIRKQ